MNSSVEQSRQQKVPCSTPEAQLMLCTYLLKLHDVWVHQEPVVENLTLHIFRHLQAKTKLFERQKQLTISSGQTTRKALSMGSLPQAVNPRQRLYCVDKHTNKVPKWFAENLAQFQIMLRPAWCRITSYKSPKA